MDTEMKDTGAAASASNKAVKEPEDLYMKMKELESELEILSIQESYLKDEQRHLKSEYMRSKEEVIYRVHFFMIHCVIFFQL